MLIKTPVLCLLMLIYMMVFYYRKPHIPIKSTRLFQGLTGVAFGVALFDLITIYTVNHRDIVPDALNLIVHVIYLLFLLGFIYLLFLYMRSYLEAGQNFRKTVKLLQAVPFFLSAIGIIVLPITYVEGKTTDYSLGPKAYALYGSVVLYLLFIAYYCLRYWEQMDSEKRLAIILAVPLYVITAAIQFAIPESLITDLNDLKIVNDTLGHSAGDELLQDFVSLLVSVVREHGNVYRQGGDEFAVLYYGDARQLLRNLEEACEIHNQSDHIPLRYAIGYCPMSDNNFMDQADQMMYEDKRQKKGSVRSLVSSGF